MRYSQVPKRLKQPKVRTKKHEYMFAGSVESETQAQYFVDKYKKDGKVAKFKKAPTFPGYTYQIFVRS